MAISLERLEAEIEERFQCRQEVRLREARSRLRESLREIDDQLSAKTAEVTRLAEQLSEKKNLESERSKRVVELQKRLEVLEDERLALTAEQKLFVNETMKTYNAFMQAKMFYKDKLNMYYSITDNGSIFAQFFTTKKINHYKFSITLKRNENCKYELIDMNPILPIFKRLFERLETTNDIVGLICCVRKCFLKCITYNEQNSIIVY